MNSGVLKKSLALGIPMERDLFSVVMVMAPYLIPINFIKSDR